MESLRDRLAALEEEHATLEAELLAFHADYLREVGSVMAELDALRARWLRLVAERSQARTDARAAEAAEQHSRRTTAEAAAVPQPAPPPATGDLKRLFREAAKRMHPDLARDEAGRAHAEAFMKRLTRAYREGDPETIVDLLRQWQASPQALAGDATANARQEAALKAAVARAERRLDEARRAPLAELMERVMQAAARGEDLLARMRVEALAARDELRQRVARAEAEAEAGAAAG